MANLFNWTFGNLFSRFAGAQTINVPISNLNINYNVNAYQYQKNFQDDAILAIPPVGGAINLVAGVISQLPLEIFSYDETNKSYVKDESHPLWDLIQDATSDDTTAPDFIYSMVQQALLRGRSVASIDRNAYGQPVNLFQMYNVSRSINAAGMKVYSGGTGDYKAANVIDFTFVDYASGSSNGGIYYNEKLFNELLAVDYYESKLNAMALNQVVEIPARVGADAKSEAEKTNSALVRELQRGNINNNIIVVPEGYTPKPFIDVSKYDWAKKRNDLVYQVSRIYNVPPFMLGLMDKGTGGSSEQQALNFMKYTIEPLITKFEKELSLKLLGRNTSSKNFIAFNRDKMLKSDLLTFATAYSNLVMRGVVTPNETRYEMNLPASSDPSADKLQALYSGNPEPVKAISNLNSNDNGAEEASQE